MKKVYSLLFFILFLWLMLFSFSFCIGAVDILVPPMIDVTSTANTATVYWDTVKDADGYEIFKKEADGEFVSVGTSDGDCYTVEGLSPNIRYEFCVRAYTVLEDNSKVYSEYSDAFARRTKLPTPANLAYVSATTDSITITWDKVEGAEFYNIHYGISGEDGYIVAGSTQENTFTIEGLSGEYRYKIKVVAKCAGNTSSYTGLIKLFTMPERPAMPRTKSKDGGSVTIEWDKAGRANAYNVYVSATPEGKYKKVATTTDTTYTYEKKTPKKAYYFKVSPLIQTDSQVTEGELSKRKKATIGNITIELPSVIRKGEYPEITVPYYDSKVKWKSSDKSVIRVKDSRFFAVGTGKATLTATYKKKYKVKVKIKVTAPTVKVPSAVYDVTNKQFIYQNKINDRCYPASITKLITALVVLKYMDEDDVIVVGDELNMVEALSSRCDIRRGEKYKLKDILYGLLLPSGGDAAYTLAVNCARKVSGNKNMGYVAAKNYFVGLMNKYMKSIGATGTRCVNPHGYPVSGHYSTVHDLVLVARKVLANKTLKKITSTPYKYVTALTGQGHSWRTTNSLLNSYAYYYSPYAHGMKTGTVDDYYTGIISAATKDDRTIITVVIGCESYNARYDATHKLYRTYLY